MLRTQFLNFGVMFSYESLEVYKKALQFHSWAYRLIKDHSTLPTYLKNQLGRAALSIPLNIAEGSAKFSKRDRRNFFVIARGSAFECSALLKILESEDEIDSLLQIHGNGKLEELSKMLFAMIRQLEA